MKKAPELLKSIMQERSITQEQLAKIIGISQPFVSMIIRGRKKLSAKMINVIAFELGLDDDTHSNLSLAAITDNGFYIKGVE